jgi:hypothetical protein
MMCHMRTGLQAPTQTAATGSWKVSMSGTSPAIADHWRRRVGLDLRQRPASSCRSRGRRSAALPSDQLSCDRALPTMSKVAGVVDQVGMPEPSFLSFHGSAGRAMMRYNSAILGD